MDFLAACEDLAANFAVFNFADEDSNVSDSDLLMWQTLFGFSLDEAAKAIQDWRAEADFTCLTISQAAWLLVKEAKMAEGYNKASYEYSLWRAQMIQKRSRMSNTDLLEHDSLSSTDSVELIRCLPKRPKILTGLDDDGNMTQFSPPFYELTLIRASVASKNLSSTSPYPTLGIDTTLPQFRINNILLENNSASDTFSIVRPAQDEYPVWYYFYGTLADASILSRIIGMTTEQNLIKYKRASVRRGRLHTLNEKYLALVDADERSKVDGWAYQVKNQNEEDSLRVYETGIYEVVRCTMELMDEQAVFIKGLTFRLA
ncbi:hypothetical protein GGI43DRAFT_421019 [Trichoderma evansii]